MWIDQQPSWRMSDQETEDFGAESLLDKSKMIPSLPPYDMDDQLLPREPRSTWCCWAWALAIVTMNFLVFFINLLLLLVIFTVVLLPTIVVVFFGFQCHSRVSKPRSLWLLTATPTAEQPMRVLFLARGEAVALKARLHSPYFASVLYREECADFHVYRLS